MIDDRLLSVFTIPFVGYPLIASHLARGYAELNSRARMSVPCVPVMIRGFRFGFSFLFFSVISSFVDSTEAKHGAKFRSRARARARNRALSRIIVTNFYHENHRRDETNRDDVRTIVEKTQIVVPRDTPIFAQLAFGARYGGRNNGDIGDGRRFAQ